MVTAMGLIDADFTFVMQGKEALLGMNPGFGRDPGGGINGGGAGAGIVLPIGHEGDGVFRGETEVLGNTNGGRGNDGKGAGKALKRSAMEIDMAGVEVIGNIPASADDKDMGGTLRDYFTISSWDFLVTTTVSRSPRGSILS